jgi:addiction module HigA family antidote
MALNETAHPGLYIKQEVLPKGLSVKDAAKLIGVGRPALSNLLNGKASLSPEMALRIEKAFPGRADSEDLLRQQADFDKLQTGARAHEIAVRVYARSFLDIKANRIEDWSKAESARSTLPALLRSLVTSTGVNLTKIDFPAYDNAQRHGWDGFVETNTATPWTPSGKSGWEFGCDQKPQAKADHDYTARVNSVSASEREEITFVFVTPKNWPGKTEWANAKRAQNQWKDVRAFDASDIEQWLEQSIPAQSWFAEKLGISTDGVSSVEQSWDRWAKVTEPELSKELFRGAINSHGQQIRVWLSKKPERPFVVAADSIDEALAFVCCALEDLSKPEEPFASKAIVIESVEGLKKTRDASQNFIAILASPEAELASAGIHKTHHTIILRRRNAVEGDADVALDLLDSKTFSAALTAMGLEEEIARYERESGQSPTILRRRLAQVPEIKSPPWAKDDGTARKLVPLALAGVWNAQTPADQEILKVLTGEEDYEKIEENIAQLLLCEQTPVWSIGRYRGVASKIDTLYAVRGHITKKDLQEFFFTAQLVLMEEDPALELPQDKRWAANIYGKTRNHSAALRKGLCETLVLLAVHGNNLLRDRLSVNVEAEVNKIVRALLTPLNANTWASQQHDLPRYAEAAPDVFLDVLNNDLKNPTPEVAHLLAPADSGMFGGGCARSGLLWALEGLAWRPERLLPVATILAKLSTYKIDDNWVNKPENSLQSIFRSWMPQTAASVDDRIAVVEKLAKKYPDVIWRLCMQQFESHAIGHYAHRPDWRNDASGAGQPLTSGQEIYKFRRKVLDIALDWPHHNEQTLGDLVAELHEFLDEDQEKIFKRIEDWAASEEDEVKKATLRERIRRSVLTRRGRKQARSDEISKRAEALYDLLLTKDLIVRHQWLFAKTWVEESYGEIEDGKFDYKKREERIAKMRATAVQEIWKDSGEEGIFRLCASGEASNVVGWLLADGILSPAKRVGFLEKLVSEAEATSSANLQNCIGGFLLKLSIDKQHGVLTDLVNRFAAEGPTSEKKLTLLLVSAPFFKETWKLVDAFGPEPRKAYWREVHPRWGNQDHEDLNLLTERLLEFERPRAALSIIRLELKEIETENLIRVLTDAATKDTETSGTYQLDPYSISEAFKVLAGRGVAVDDLARLEFMYLSALERSEYGIPNLERQLVAKPSIFMEALAFAYKRNDGGEDPPEWRRANSEGARSIATQAYWLLHKAKRTPGTGDDGTINVKELKTWITEVRALCKTYGRVEVGDLAIGDLLSKSKPGADGIWPNEATREALEDVGTKDIARGMGTGLYNARGAHWRGEGGEQERELATKYRDWSKRVANESPFTSQLLEQIALNYDNDAKWHDTDANVRKRLSY